MGKSCPPVGKGMYSYWSVCMHSIMELKLGVLHDTDKDEVVESNTDDIRKAS